MSRKRGLEEAGEDGRSSSPMLRLNTKNCCFICLKPVTDKDTKLEDKNSGLGVVSLHNLCRCLNLNIGKVLKSRVLQLHAVPKNKDSDDDIPLSSSSPLGKSDLTVTMCAKCEGTTTRFSELYQELEIMRMEMEHCLDIIQQWLTETDKDKELKAQFHQLMASDIHSLLYLGIVDELRSEVAQKCSKAAANFQPRVKVKRFDKEEAPKSKETGSGGANPSPATSQPPSTSDLLLEASMSPSLVPTKEPEQQPQPSKSSRPAPSSSSDYYYADDEPSFPCRHCPKTFMFKSNLLEHYKIAHPTENPPMRASQAKSLPPPQPLRPPQKKSFPDASRECSYCGKVFRTRKGKYKHIAKTHLGTVTAPLVDNVQFNSVPLLYPPPQPDPAPFFQQQPSMILPDLGNDDNAEDDNDEEDHDAVPEVEMTCEEMKMETVQTQEEDYEDEDNDWTTSGADPLSDDNPQGFMPTANVNQGGPLTSITHPTLLFASYVLPQAQTTSTAPLVQGNFEMNPATKLFECPECGKQFTRRWNVRKHYTDFHANANIPK